MKIIIKRDTLIDALSQVIPFASPKAAIAILRYAKITTKGNRIKFESNDAHASMRRYAEAVEIDQDGSFLVNPADVFSLVSKCKDEDITLVVDGETLTVKHKKGEATFQVMRVEEYPDFDMPNNDITEISLPTALLLDCIKVAKGFVGSDDLRPQMKAIYAYVKDGEFGYCATDTRKMNTDHNTVDNVADLDVNWYIEPSVFSAITKACKDVENVVVKVSPSHVSYRIGNTIIQTVQTKGNYPDFNRVIPKTWGMECGVDRSELIDSLKRVSLQCDDSRIVKLDISQMDMAITSENFQHMKKASETLQHNGCNGNITIGMQIDYLLICLESCAADEVVLRLADASRPMILHQADKPNATILLMPMTIV